MQRICHRIAVFTPTYNRAHLLPRLYESLLVQVMQDFYWLIVDDGSTDSTYELVQGWANDGRLEIQYMRQQNAGKMAAINAGVEICGAELFFIVDSDDLLTDTALEQVLACWDARGGDEFSGVVALRGDIQNSQPIGGTWMPDVQYETLSALFAVRGLRGDVALTYRTDILRQHPFPMIKGEKFVPEGYIWSEIDKDYKLVVLNEIVYLCEYQADGYSRNVRMNQVRNPQGFMLSYRQQFDMAAQFPWRKRFARRFRYTIGLFALHFITRPDFGLGFLFKSSWGLLYPAGYAAYLVRYRSLVHQLEINID